MKCGACEERQQQLFEDGDGSQVVCICFEDDVMEQAEILTTTSTITATSHDILVNEDDDDNDDDDIDFVKEVIDLTNDEDKDEEEDGEEEEEEEEQQQQEKEEGEDTDSGVEMLEESYYDNDSSDVKSRPMCIIPPNNHHPVDTITIGD